jgi:hypothetical protein
MNEIKSRSNSGNVCSDLARNLLSSRFIYKDTKLKICRTIIFPVFFTGLKLGLSIYGKNHRLKVFENKVQRMYLGLTGAQQEEEEEEEEEENSVTRICTRHQILFGSSNQGE